MTTKRIDGIKYNLDKMTDEELTHLASVLTKRLVNLSNDLAEVRITRNKRKHGKSR